MAYYMRLVGPPLVWRAVRGRSLPSDAVDCVIGRNRYGVYCVPQSSKHRPAARTVLRHGVWEPETIEMLVRAAVGDVVHAGTYFGDFLPAVAKSRRLSGGTVWGFEPNKDNYQCAKATQILNGLTNVVLTPAALGSERGSTFLRTRNARSKGLGGASHVVEEPWSDDAGVEEVAVETIDGVIPSTRVVAALHLDLEGHEEAALQGALYTITRCNPDLILETLPSEQFFEAVLQPLGYRAHDPVDHNFVLSCRGR